VGGVGTKSTFRGQGKLEVRRDESWGMGRERQGKTIPTKCAAGGALYKLSQWGPGQQEFWYILGSSDDLFCSPAMQNCL